jgi:hypothetical protein
MVETRAEILKGCIIIILRYSNIVWNHISSDSVLYLLFCKIIDDRLHTKTYCKIVAWCAPVIDKQHILYIYVTA